MVGGEVSRNGVDVLVVGMIQIVDKVEVFREDFREISDKRSDDSVSGPFGDVSAKVFHSRVDKVYVAEFLSSHRIAFVFKDLEELNIEMDQVMVSLCELSELPGTGS